LRPSRETSAGPLNARSPARLWRILSSDFPDFAGRTLPYPGLDHRSVISVAKEITDALVSDRGWPRLFPDRGVDGLGAGCRLADLDDHFATRSAIAPPRVSTSSAGRPANHPTDHDPAAFGP